MALKIIKEDGRKKRHSKFNPNAGNVPAGVDLFNHSTFGKDLSEIGSGDNLGTSSGMAEMLQYLNDNDID